MLERHRNSLVHLERTLADLGSDARQRRYKQSVPFVHVPIELAAQCDEYDRLLDDDTFYRGWFDGEERNALRAVFVAVRRYVSADEVADVDSGILDDPAWRDIMTEATLLHERLVAAGRIALR